MAQFGCNFLAAEQHPCKEKNEDNSGRFVMVFARFLLLAIVLMIAPPGANAYESKDLQKAADAYAAEIMRDNAKSAVAAPSAFKAAKELAGQKNWRKAVTRYEQTIVKNPDHAGAWLGLAVAWFNIERKHERAAISAYRAFHTAINDTQRAWSLFVLGKSFEAQELFQPAIKQLEASLALAANETVKKNYDQLVFQHGFKALEVKVDAESDRPEFCVVFRHPLAKGKQIRYADYLRIEPPVTGNVVARGKNLCVDGVSHGKTHSVAVLPGLPAVDGATTGDTDVFTVTVPNRSPSVAFRGNTYILPRTGSTGVPVVTVNVDRVRLKILRITERNLMGELNNERIGRLLDPWDIKGIDERSGETVWQGEMDVSSTRNDRVTTAFPIGQVLKEIKPGVHVLIAEPVGVELKRWASRATQWLVVSDLGLTTFKGADGLHVFARSLASGKPASDVTVGLYARNNSLLGEARSDASGMVRFAPGLLRGQGGRAAKAVFASSGGEDFTFLDLTSPSFDLSDRGVGGRAAPGPMDAYVYADRGVYRPGETAHLVTLLRDDKAKAIHGLPLTLRLMRPDGAEARRQTLKSPALGAYQVDIPFPPGARTGKWTAQIHADPTDDPIGRLSILVEDVVPPRIEVRMKTQAKHLAPQTPIKVAVNADYLYGAPANDLPAEAEVVVLKDETPFPAYAGYRFGLAEEKVSPSRSKLEVRKSDASGRIDLDVVLGDIPDTTLPLKAVIRAGVFEMGGRPAMASLTLPVRQRANAIGLRPRFKDGVGEGGEAAFDVIALDQNGKPVAAGLAFAFIKEDWDYRWFLRNGVWDYEINIIDQPLGGGALSLTAAEPAKLASRVDWGRYRLEVYDAKTGAASSVRFRAGWFVTPTAADRPDLLEVVSDKRAYRPGEMVKIHIKPPFAGEVLLSVASDRILETRSVSAPAEGTTVEIPFAEDWGVGAYILATAFRPDSKKRGPGRAIGLTWIDLDSTPRTLAVTVDAPKEVTGRRTITIPITVTGLDAGKAAYVTLAAVDDGVLQLTGFKTPDPAGHYYGKRRLGVGVRDLYGKLIDAKTGRRGRIRSGGGDPRLAGRGAPPVDIKIVALFSGLVRLDGDGKAGVPLEIPDFNGRLRLMAVAFDAARVGSAHAPLLVRDPLVAQVSRPRFLAPGDESRLTLTLRNLKAPAGKYTAAFTARGAARFTGTTEITRTLKPGQSASATVGLSGVGPGSAKLKMALSGPDGLILERSWTLGVRPAQFPVTRHIAKRLSRGGTVTYSDALLSEFVPGSGQVLLAFSPRPDLDVPGLLDSLDRYPYGCLEQTTSRALPLLYLSSVADMWGGKGAESDTPSRIRKAILRILNMQRRDGAFGLWNSAGKAEPWLTAYAVDFLTRAKKAGYEVPAFAHDGALEWLKRSVRKSERSKPSNLAATAYALYALAAAGEGKAATVRYIADTYVDKMPTPMAAAQVAAALALHGEADRARTYFGKARAAMGKRERIRDYGTSLRDTAGLVTLASETGKVLTNVERDWGAGSLPVLVEDLIDRQKQSTYTSPQEQAWMLMAAAALGGDTGDMALSLGDEILPVRKKPLYVRPQKARLKSGLTYENRGEKAVWHTATIMGTPIEEEPALAQGFTLERTFRDLDGKPVDLATVRQNDVVVVVIKGTSTTDLDHQALIVDLLPAGFEIENARLEHRRSTTEMAWLPKLSETVHGEFRDDRFVAALDIKGKKRGFAVAYLARAVTPGKYRLPAAHVEDMYKPRFRARTAMGSVTIAPVN
jgi:alpha-2-macroglobulin